MIKNGKKTKRSADQQRAKSCLCQVRDFLPYGLLVIQAATVGQQHGKRVRMIIMFLKLILLRRWERIIILRRDFNMKDDFRDIYFVIYIFIFSFLAILATGIYIETL